jgi:hypothetical protein
MGEGRMLRCVTAPALALLVAAAPAAAGEGLVPAPLDALRPGPEAAALVTLRPDGLAIGVEGTTGLAAPKLSGAQVLELDVDVAGVMLLTWAARTPGAEFAPFGPPWRHLTVPVGRSTLRLDLRIARDWTTAAEPQIGLTGTGTVVVRALRWLPPDRDAERQVAAFDRANFWAPESMGHTTINLLTHPFWSEARRIWLTDVVAAVAAVAFAVVLAATRLRGGRPRPALALAVAALVASGLWGAHLLVRFLPVFDLRPTPDREQRIRENYWVAPDVGALAALARERLGPTERVGVVARERDWFGPQTLCFNLAPRPCVIMRPGQPVHHGIYGVGALRDDEIDAIVFFRGEWTPPGFQRIAGLGPNRWLGRRP